MNANIMAGLEILGMGMAGLFVAMLLIMIMTMILNSFKSKKKD